MSLLDVIFPKKCLECKQRGNYICTNCLKKVSPSFPKCIECIRYSKRGITHKKCKKRYSIDKTISLWRHDGVIRKSLLSIKYKFAHDVASELVEKYLKNIDTKLLPKKGIMVPVPLHTKRKKWRGFNQAENLGKLTAKKLDLIFIPDLLIRSKNTTPQTELNKKIRKTNLKNAFSFNPKYNKFNPRNHQMVIFDDVLTTGSTLRECGKVLKQNGVKKVIGMTICG